MYSKNKKIKKISLLSALFITLSSTTFGLALSSCANSKINNPSTSAASFTSLFKSVLPTVSSVLSSSKGREEINTTYINKLLSKWYDVVVNPEIENFYQDWTESAEQKYKDKYNEYKKNKGKNWRQLFQQDVLDPVGGTKQLFIFNELKTNFKTTLVDNIFNDDINDYLGYQNTPNGKIISITDINKNSLESLDNSFVNASTAGQKNGFIFSADAMDSNDIVRIDYGYADLLNFIMDSWVKNELPLPLSMSLWKNDTDLFQMNQLFSGYFNRNNSDTNEENNEDSDSSTDSDVSTTSLSRESSDDSKKFEPSYNFQFFQQPGINPTNLTTTDKFNKLLTNLGKGNYVDTKTGLIKLPTKYTEDSSTSLITSANSLFDGTYVTPFSAAAWYKFSNFVFGIQDNNINVANKIDNTSIMNNFLVFKSNSSNQKAINILANNNVPTGAFMFPYPIQWSNPYSQSMTSVFTNDYLNAIGIIDVLNLSNSTSLTNGNNNSSQPSTNEITQSANSNLQNFILVRNTFGVHLIGIDRLSKLKEAYNSSSASDFQTKFNNVCNELRNTFMYYLAVDIKNSSTTYGIIDSLKKYFSDNFETILFSYIQKFIDNPSQNKNNLFGSYVTQNLQSDSTINYSQNYGFELEKDGKSFTDYCDVLNEIKNGTNLRNLINTALSYKYASKAYEFCKNINTKIYENQSSYNDNLDPNNWLMNGIAGCLSFTRDTKNGEFTSLVQLINSIVTNKLITNNTVNYNDQSDIGRNKIKSFKSESLSISSNNQNITVTNALTNLQKAKNDYQKSLVTYLNSANLVVVNSTNNDYIGVPTYIFTNNEYVNQALVNVSSSDLSSIVSNLYRQRYIYPNGKKITFTDGTNTEGSNAWIENKINNAINSTYVINNFVNDNNVYALGDWTDDSSLQKNASQYFNDNWNLNEYSYTLSEDNLSFCSYDSVSDAENYYKLLVTLRYIVDYNSDTKNFNFKPLYDFLNEATKITNTTSSKALVAWVNQNSILKDSNFGTTISSTTPAKTVNEIQNAVSNDSSFKKAPILLTNVNSYSWYGAPNPYPQNNNETNSKVNQLNSNEITYTTDTNYWITSPMSVNDSKKTSTNNTGFVGFQFESTSQTSGLSNVLPSSVFDNSTYSALFSNQTNLQYLGMLYSFGNRQDTISYVNGLSNPFLLTRFYENNLKNSGLPLTDKTKNDIDDIINSSSAEINRFEKLQQKLVEVLNDNQQVPDIAFYKMASLPIWNNADGESTTLFDSSDTTTGLKNEYVISQFNNNDVNKLLTNNVLTSSANGGYLGLNPTTFFNAIVMLAEKSSYLQDQAINNMMEVVGKISIYDIRLISIFDRMWITNYDDWKKVQDL